MSVSVPSFQGESTGVGERFGERSPRVIVCGGRRYANRARVFAVLGEFLSWPEPPIILHGGALGADRLARQWADFYRCVSIAYAADWKKYGAGAGPIRNEIMVRRGAPDLGVAFPGGNGTEDACRRMKAAGVPVVRHWL